MMQCDHVHARIQWGDRGPDPPGKSQAICVSIEISIWTTPSPHPGKSWTSHPLENVRTPLKPWKNFSEQTIDTPLDPLCKTVKVVED